MNVSRKVLVRIFYFSHRSRALEPVSLFTRCATHHYRAQHLINNPYAPYLLKAVHTFQRAGALHHQSPT